MRQISFLGLGVMGLPMTKNLVTKSGCSVLGYDVVPEQAAAFQAAGGIAVEAPAEIYHSCQIIFQILPPHPIIIHSVEQTVQYEKPGGIVVTCPRPRRTPSWISFKRHRRPEFAWWTPLSSAEPPWPPPERWLSWPAANPPSLRL